MYENDKLITTQRLSFNIPQEKKMIIIIKGRIPKTWHGFPQHTQAQGYLYIQYKGDWRAVRDWKMAMDKKCATDEGK